MRYDSTMRSVGVVVRHAVAVAVAASPTIALLDSSCGSGDPASDAAPSGCDVQWQGPVSMSCFTNPFFYSGPVATGTMSNPEACGLGDAAPTADVCASICGRYGPLCIWDGADTIYCTDTTDIHPDTLCGRRPCGLRRVRAQHSTGARLAHAAYLEEASVVAFEILHAELVAHRAPRSLQRAALRARKDEQRHARMTARLARRRGARPAMPSVMPMPARNCLAIAIENVVEGCVRETYGAAVAMWQAEHARAHDVRALMRSIADDEVRHADLGWRVDAWVNEKLDANGRAAVRKAGRDAVRDLWANAANPGDDELGLPDADAARMILSRLALELWEPAFNAVTQLGRHRCDGASSIRDSRRGRCSRSC